MTTDAERLKEAKRQLGGINSALNRAREHEHQMFTLSAEMYDALPAAERETFMERFEAEAKRARKGKQGR